MVSKTIVPEKTDAQELEKTNKADADNGQTETRAAGAVDVTTTSSAKSDNGGRKRKRHLFNSIRAQMEFYFGDANLSKDRFLRRYVEQDPYVPLDIFLTFNKIKTLTQDVQQISKSLSNSQLLELDESGLKVRRKTALPVQRDVNDKTLYVEGLPHTATHDWLKEVFSRYGAVAYVSLPHYPGTKKIKEFAFIEFEKSASVEKAVKAFAQVQGVLSVESTDPADLASIRTFQAQPSKLEDVQEANTEPATVVAAIKREAEKEAAPEMVTAKRLKLEEQSEAAGQEEGTTDAETSQQSEPEDKDAAKDAVKQQKRRRKQKKKIAVDKHKPNIEPSAMELKVLPKSSWCSMRNKYLNLQRRIISEAKAKLWRNSQNTPNQSIPNKMQQQLQAQQQQLVETKGKTITITGAETEPLSDVGDAVDAVAPLPTKRRKRNKNNAGVHKMNMNFYGAGGSEADNDNKIPVKTEYAAQVRSPLFKYEPGLIVECSLHEPCANVKDFKADMRQYPDIKYVDIKEGDKVAHLRMSTPNAADDLTRQLNCAEMQLRVLRGQLESDYWHKIELDREAKLTKKVRVQQKRGREKVSKLLAKHIKFDDADDEVTAAPPPSAGVGSSNEPPAPIISIPTDV